MPPKPKLGISRGVECKQCGADEWVQRRERSSYRCAPCTRRQKRTHVNRKMKGRPAYRLWRKAKTRAAAQGVAFDLTVDDVEAIWPADNICPALGLQMREGATVGSGFLPSIDRLIPQWGYTRGNVAVISMRANMLKNNGSAAELEQIAAWMKSNGLS